MNRAPAVRSRRAVLVALAISLVLAGCANSDNDASSDRSTGDGAQPDEASTHTVEDTFLGDIDGVPTDPQRVVALWRTGSLLADMGAQPVGALADEFSKIELEPAVFAEYEDVPVVGTYDGIDIEKLIALEPDLVIGMDNGGLGFDYEEIQQVAPTVILDIAEPTDVWDNYPTVAELMGETTDFDERSAALDARLAEVKEQYGDSMGELEATSIGAYGGSLWVDTSKSLTWRRLDAAGFGYNPEYTKEPERYVTELSLENLADLSDTDIIFYDVGLNGKPLPETQEVLDTASFKRLPAAQKGNVFPLTSGTIYTFAAGNEQVDDLVAAAEAYQP